MARRRRYSDPVSDTVRANRSAARLSAAEAKKAAAEAARRQADAAVERAKADAAARAAESALKLKRFEAEQAKEARAAKKADEANSLGAKAWNITLALGGPAVGILIGHKMAKRIETRHVETMKARRTAAQSLARAANSAASSRAATQAAKLRGIVRTGDRLKIGSVRGPLGLATAGLLLAEGAFSRYYVAPQMRKDGSPAAADAFSTMGTASLFAATNLVGERMMHNATPPVVPAAHNLAAVEAAREMTKRSNVKNIGDTLAKQSAAPKAEPSKTVPKAQKKTATKAAAKKTGVTKVKAEKLPTVRKAPKAPKKITGEKVALPRTSPDAALKPVNQSPWKVAGEKVAGGASKVLRGTSNALTVGGLAFAGAMAYQAGAGRAEAAGLSKSKRVASGVTAAAVTVGAGAGIAAGTHKVASIAQKGLSSVAAKTAVTRGIAKVGSFAFKRALPVAGTALLLKDAIDLYNEHFTEYRSTVIRRPSDTKRARATKATPSSATRRRASVKVSDGVVDAHYRVDKRTGRRTFVRAFTRKSDKGATVRVPASMR